MTTTAIEHNAALYEDLWRYFDLQPHTIWAAWEEIAPFAAPEARSQVLELANVFRARVVDVAPESLTIEITGTEDKIDRLLDVLGRPAVLTDF